MSRNNVFWTVRLRWGQIVQFCGEEYWPSEYLGVWSSWEAPELGLKGTFWEREGRGGQAACDKAKPLLWVRGRRLINGDLCIWWKAKSVCISFRFSSSSSLTGLSTDISLARSLHAWDAVPSALPSVCTAFSNQKACGVTLGQPLERVFYHCCLCIFTSRQCTSLPAHLPPVSHRD